MIRSVIKQCALERDLDLFDAGDETEVGEKGITLRCVPSSYAFPTAVDKIVLQWRPESAYHPRACRLLERGDPSAR